MLVLDEKLAAATQAAPAASSAEAAATATAATESAAAATAKAAALAAATESTATTTAAAESTVSTAAARRRLKDGADLGAQSEGLVALVLANKLRNKQRVGLANEDFPANLVRGGRRIRRLIVDRLGLFALDDLVHAALDAVRRIGLLQNVLESSIEADVLEVDGNRALNFRCDGIRNADALKQSAQSLPNIDGVEIERRNDLIRRIGLGVCHGWHACEHGQAEDR